MYHVLHVKHCKASGWSAITPDGKHTARGVSSVDAWYNLYDVLKFKGLMPQGEICHSQNMYYQPNNIIPAEEV